MRTTLETQKVRYFGVLHRMPQTLSRKKNQKSYLLKIRRPSPDALDVNQNRKLDQLFFEKQASLTGCPLRQLEQKFDCYLFGKSLLGDFQSVKTPSESVHASRESPTGFSFGLVDFLIKFWPHPPLIQRGPHPPPVFLCRWPPFRGHRSRDCAYPRAVAGVVDRGSLVLTDGRLTSYMGYAQFFIFS